MPPGAGTNQVRNKSPYIPNLHLLAASLFSFWSCVFRSKAMDTWSHQPNVLVQFSIFGSHPWNCRGKFSQIKQRFLWVPIFMLKNSCPWFYYSELLVSCEPGVSSLGFLRLITTFTNPSVTERKNLPDRVYLFKNCSH